MHLVIIHYDVYKTTDDIIILLAMPCIICFTPHSYSVVSYIAVTPIYGVLTPVINKRGGLEKRIQTASCHPVDNNISTKHAHPDAVV